MLFNQFVALMTVPLQDGMIELVSLPGLRQLFSPTSPPWVKEYLTDSEGEKIRLSKDKYMIKRSIMRYILAVEKEIIAFRNYMKMFDVPYLLIYSENDPITPAWGNNAMVARHNHPDNQMVLLVGNQYHEQLFSAAPLQGHILKVIDSWLQVRMNDEKKR